MDLGSTNFDAGAEERRKRDKTNLRTVRVLVHSTARYHAPLVARGSHQSRPGKEVLAFTSVFLVKALVDYRDKGRSLKSN